MASILVHGLKFDFKSVPLTSIPELAKLCPEDVPLMARDTPDAWHIPIVSRTEQGEYKLWQTSDLWKFVLSKQRPANTCVFVCRPDQDSVLESKIRELIHFQSCALAMNDSEELLKTFYDSPTLEKTFSELFGLPFPIHYEMIIKIIGDDKISSSAVYRARKKYGKTNSLPPSTRFNRFIHKHHLPKYGEICVLLAKHSEALDRFIKAVHDDKVDFDVLCKKIHAYLNERGLLPKEGK